MEDAGVFLIPLGGSLLVRSLLWIRAIYAMYYENEVQLIITL